MHNTSIKLREMGSGLEIKHFQYIAHQNPQGVNEQGELRRMAYASIRRNAYCTLPHCNSRPYPRPSLAISISTIKPNITETKNE